ncbi:MAG: hypothetical protein WC909_02090 [Candidatus Paceibacterota bacterium]|jgi:hypothetical protein
MLFSCFYYPEEKDYIDKFKEFYSDNILTPDGYIIYFNTTKDSHITHFWRGGKGGDFKKQRAAKIGWIKEILENDQSRVVKVNPNNVQQIFFICTENHKQYVIRCKNNKNNYLFCYTAYPITTKQCQRYLKWDNFS